MDSEQVHEIEVDAAVADDQDERCDCPECWMQARIAEESGEYL